MFFGQFEHNLDDKSRLLIPSKIRENCGTKVYILKGFDGALSVFKEEGFIKLVQEAEKLAFNHKTNRDYLRSVLGSVTEIEIDKAGRMQIPTYLINKFGIGKTVIIVGVYDHFEIWDKKTYEEYEKKVNENFEDIAERIVQKDE